MSEKIPPSPSQADYAARAANDPPLPEAGDPIALFGEWFEDAKKKEPNDPNAMALATVDQGGMPDVRMVLLKDFAPAGFVFYSNTESAKGLELEANPKAALGFHWKSLRRQVRVRGPVWPVSETEADAYFATRARDAQIGAWASDQSRPMAGRFEFEKRIATQAARFGVGPVPRPPYWHGYRVLPLEIEFWRDRPFRLHERLRFSRAAVDAPWSTARLYP